MDRETLLQALEHGPIRVTMNDGSSYDIESLRDVAVDSSTCYLMRRGTDGRYHAVWLSLVCMTKVEQLSTVADLDIATSGRIVTPIASADGTCENPLADAPGSEKHWQTPEPGAVQRKVKEM